MSTLKLNYLQHPSSSTANITLASTGAVAVNGAMTGAGLDLISPTSVAYSTGSASASGGLITFTGVSSISLNGIFSSSYDAYRISSKITAASQNSIGISMRFRSSGTDNSVGNYNNTSIGLDTSGASANLVGDSATSFSIGLVGTGVVVWGLSCDVISPFQTSTTYVHGSRSNFAGTGTGSNGTLTAHHYGTTSFDGFSFIASAGTVTGTIRVYGYKNS
jgi:hypothetical protein